VLAGQHAEAGNFPGNQAGKKVLLLSMSRMADQEAVPP